MTQEQEGYWWCAECREEVDAACVTYQEKHEACGHPVTWVEPHDPIARLRDELGEARRESVEWKKLYEQTSKHFDTATQEAARLKAELEEAKGARQAAWDSEYEARTALKEREADLLAKVEAAWEALESIMTGAKNYGSGAPEKVAHVCMMLSREAEKGLWALALKSAWKSKQGETR